VERNQNEVHGAFQKEEPEATKSMADLIDRTERTSAHAALKFVLMIGVVSFFADFTYEGSRSITGPYLAILGATGTAVGIIAGVGELLGYGLRLASGTMSERTGEFWPITLFGYFVQMLSVPALALAGNWKAAAALIILERIGKAIRNPPRDVMLSHAAKQMGYGWGFGVHEALDQFGALFGPLLVAAILARRHGYIGVYAAFLIPALVTLTLLVVARLIYPRPADMEPEVPDLHTEGLSDLFWLYMIGAALVAAGFADYSLIAYHFEKTASVPNHWVPIFYSVAMAVSGLGSLFFGRLFDRIGIGVLIPLTVISALATPLVFLGNFKFALLGCAIWGLGMGVHESIIPAAVATMVPRERRPSAYGIFTGAYGVAWFLGSVLIGVLYDVSVPLLIAFSVIAELAAIPAFLKVRRMARATRGSAITPENAPRQQC
jgi:MFS family permease